MSNGFGCPRHAVSCAWLHTSSCWLKGIWLTSTFTFGTLWKFISVVICSQVLALCENHSMQGLDSNCFCICGISHTCVPSRPSYLMWTSMPSSSRWRSQWYYCLSGCWSPHLLPWEGGLLPYRWKALIGGQGPWTVPISSSSYRFQGSGYSVSLTCRLYQPVSGLHSIGSSASRHVPSASRTQVKTLPPRGNCGVKCVCSQKFKIWAHLPGNGMSIYTREGMPVILPLSSVFVVSALARKSKRERLGLKLGSPTSTLMLLTPVQSQGCPRWLLSFFKEKETNSEVMRWAAAREVICQLTADRTQIPSCRKSCKNRSSENQTNQQMA